MPESESTILRSSTQSHNQTSFQEWKDALLLREMQTVKERRQKIAPKYSEAAREFLQVFGLSPADYTRLDSIAHGERCCGHCPCRYADRLNGSLLVKINYDSEGKRQPCTLRNLGRIFHEAASETLPNLTE